MASPSRASGLELTSLGTSRAAHRYRRLDSAVDWVNSQTAGFLQDHEGYKEYHQPRSRVLTRFFFTLGVFMLSLLLVLMFPFIEDTTLETARYWGANYALDHFTPYLSRQNSSLDSSFKTRSAFMLCPCSNMAFSWTSFVDFFTISYNSPQNVVRTSRITNGTEFCFETVRSYRLNSTMIARFGCPNLINSVVDSTDVRTLLRANWLMDPILLRVTLQRYAQSNLAKALNQCVLSMAKGTDWSTFVSFEWLRNIFELFQASIRLYGSNPHATDLDFWNAANETVAISFSHVRLTQVIADKVAVGMRVDWAKYARQCSPMYCDVVKETSFGAEFLAALAEIGGFCALMLLVIRKIVWPLICLLGRWKSLAGAGARVGHQLSF